VKYLVMGLLLISVLLVSACSSMDVADNDYLGDQQSVVDEEIEADILPELVDPDEYIEIGEMI